MDMSTIYESSSTSFFDESMITKKIAQRLNF